MKGVRILHTADLHIGSSRGGLSSQRGMGRYEIKNTFFRILKFCKSESIDFLLISGDLFDTPFPEEETVSELVHAMAQIPDTVIAISPGNHDFLCPGSVYAKTVFPENVIVFTPETKCIDFPEKNVKLFGAPFTERFHSTSLLKDLGAPDPQRVNLCVLHGNVTSARSEDLYNPITENDIKNSGFDYLALGHIHKRTDIEKIGETCWAYCGCPDGRGFDEDGSLGIYSGTVGKGFCDLEYTEFSSRKYIFDKVNITGCKNSLQVSEQILSHLKELYPDTYGDHLYQITLTGTVPDSFVPNLSQTEASLSEELLYIRLSDNTDTEADIETIMSESSLRGIFARKLSEMSATAGADDLDLYRQALRLGLRAFEGEVVPNDN